MKNIVINGINGKMGKAVYAAAAERKDFNVVCGVDKRAIGNFDCPVYPTLAQVCEHTDALIDFSSPSALNSVLDFATENACALVLATTGYSAAQLAQIEKAAQVIPVKLTANTSLGIYALKKILPVLKQTLDGYDVSIAEAHGKNKKDRPSGTALDLARTLGNCAEINSVRGGDLPGVHTVTFLGGEESVTITHTVFSRKVFAEGALDICASLIGKPHGLY